MWVTDMKLKVNLDELYPWLVASTLVVMCTLSVLSYHKPHRPHILIDLKEVHKPHDTHTIMHDISFNSISGSLAARKNSNIIKTAQQTSLYNRYVAAWQNTVRSVADRYIANNGVPTGSVVVIVDVGRNGHVTKEIIKSSNSVLSTDIRSILSMVQSFPAPPSNIGKNGIWIERQWNFT